MFEFFRLKVITGLGKVPYLIRLTIFGCKWFSFKLHIFTKSDDDCLHDHPWPFFTFILIQGYYEIMEDGRVIRRKPFRLLYRKAKSRHRVILIDNKPAMTFVITFRKLREWGFINKFGEWIHWKKYLVGKDIERC